MMKSYIDEKYMVHFFESLVKSNDFGDEREILNSIRLYFKGKTDILLDTDFDSILNGLDPGTRQRVSDILLTQWITGRNGTKVFVNQKNNKFRELKNINLYNKLKNPFASFWVGDHYKYPVEKYSKNNPYYFLTPNDDISKWKSLSNSKTFYVGPSTNKKSKDTLQSWDQLIEFAHPFKDIIISDHFCFSDLNRIKKNIIPLISALSSIDNKIENIMLFTEKGKLAHNSKNKTYNFIKESINDLGIKSNLIIYQIDKRNDYFNLLHDRYILTNNLFIKSGDSFDYFNDNGTFKTNGTSISLMPIFEANKAEVSRLIMSCKSIMENANTDMFFGTKSKNILDLIDNYN